MSSTDAVTVSRDPAVAAPPAPSAVNAAVNPIAALSVRLAIVSPSQTGACRPSRIEAGNRGERGHRRKFPWLNGPAATAMPSPSTADVTQLLLRWGQGNEAALNQLVPLVQAELRRIARRQMGHERAGHT